MRKARNYNKMGIQLLLISILFLPTVIPTGFENEAISAQDERLIEQSNSSKAHKNPMVDLINRLNELCTENSDIEESQILLDEDPACQEMISELDAEVYLSTNKDSISGISPKQCYANPRFCFLCVIGICCGLDGCEFVPTFVVPPDCYFSFCFNLPNCVGACLYFD